MVICRGAVQREGERHTQTKNSPPHPPLPPLSPFKPKIQPPPTTKHTHTHTQVELTPRQGEAVRRMRASRSMREFHAELHHFTGHETVDQYFKVHFWIIHILSVYESVCVRTGGSIPPPPLN